MKADVSTNLSEKLDGGISEPAAVRLWLRLLTCSITVEKRLRRRLVDQFDTTLPRFDVLAALHRNARGMTMGDLSQALLVSGGNLTALVRQLRDRGFVSMQRDPNDGRSWIVCITEEGRHHFSEVASAHHHWIADMFGGLPADRCDVLYELLAEVKESLATEGERTLEARYRK